MAFRTPDERNAAMLESRSPQRPGDLVVAVEEVSAAGVAESVKAARAAQRDWASAPALQRSPATALGLRLGELIGPCLPEGLFQVVPGSSGTARALIEQADVVSFTGSVEVGHAVASQATARGIPSQAEMGGLNASIVLPDADP